MIKVSAFLPKRADLTDEQFHAHWRHPHGDLAVRTQRIRRYVQDHGVGPRPGLPGFPKSTYLGVATVWFVSLESFMGLHGDPDFAASHADEGSFLDVPRLGWLILDEQIPLPGPPRQVGDAEYAKAMVFLKRRADVDETAFAEAVASHTNVALSLPGLARFNWALPNPRFYRERAIAPLFDASLEYCFDDLAALDAAFTDAPALRDDLARFADLGAGESFRAIEERWFWPDR